MKSDTLHLEEISIPKVTSMDNFIFQFKKDIKAKIDAIRPKLHKAVDLALQEVEETILQSS